MYNMSDPSNPVVCGYKDLATGCTYAQCQEYPHLYEYLDTTKLVTCNSYEDCWHWYNFAGLFSQWQQKLKLGNRELFFGCRPEGCVFGDNHNSYYMHGDGSLSAL